MTIYLINPSERKILENAGDRMPLGLLYMAKSIENKGSPVKVYDLNHDDEDKMMIDIVRNRPEIVGVSCLTSPMLEESKRLIRRLKYLQTKRIIVGGYHPSVLPETFEGLAEVVQGEGELFFGERTDRPSRHLLKQENYNMQMDGLRTSTMITSRGCPNNCVFCGNISRKVRYHNLEDIQLEIKEIAKHYNAIYFLDDVFTLNQERAKYISKLCKDNGLKFRVTTRANLVNSDLLEQLADDGCIWLSMGVESGNSSILEEVGKNQTKTQIENAVADCSEAGIKVKGFFILGLPHETERTAQDTIEFAKRLKDKGMTCADFYPLIPFPGTEIWTNPHKFGITIFDRDYSHYLQATRGEPKVVCETRELNADRIGSLLKQAKEIW